MKFDGILPEAEADAKAAVLTLFERFDIRPKQVYFQRGQGAYEFIYTMLMEFAKAGSNHFAECLSEVQKTEFNRTVFPQRPLTVDEIREPKGQVMKEPDSGLKQFYFEADGRKFIVRAASEEEAKQFMPKDTPCIEIRAGNRLQELSFELEKLLKKRKSSVGNQCGEITLGQTQICELATGILPVPHSACQTCGEVVNAIGVDRFGYKHPDIHASSFGFASSYFPTQFVHHAHEPSKSFQAEDRIHRAQATTEVKPIDEKEILENLKNKREIHLRGTPFSEKKTLTDHLKAHPCKGFQVHPAYFPNGDFITIYFENALAHTEDVAKNVSVELASNLGRSDANRIVGVKLFRVKELNLYFLPEAEHDWLKQVLRVIQGNNTFIGFNRRQINRVMKRFNMNPILCDECGDTGYGNHGQPGETPCPKCNS